MIKSDEEVNLKYMQAWEERIMEINEAKCLRGRKALMNFAKRLGSDIQIHNVE